MGRFTPGACRPRRRAVRECRWPKTTGLLQWGNAERRFTCDGKLPIHHQVLSVDFYPRLDQLQLPRRDMAVKHITAFDRDCGLFVLIANVDVRQMVASIVPKVHQDQDPVEHADGGHGHSCVRWLGTPAALHSTVGAPWGANGVRNQRPTVVPGVDGEFGRVAKGDQAATGCTGGVARRPSDSHPARSGGAGRGGPATGSRGQQQQSLAFARLACGWWWARSAGPGWGGASGPPGSRPCR